MKKNLFCFFAFVFVVALLGEGFATPTINDLKVTPIEPLGLAIDYKVSGATEDDAGNYYLSVSMCANGTTYLAGTLSGATKCIDGEHRVYWKVANDGITLEETDLSVMVAYKPFPLYCVIDLSKGASADSYPVTYRNRDPGINVNKLVLKRVDAGTFIMGEDQTDESQRVTLTRPFYMGVYEVTQKQWALVMGSQASKTKKEGMGDYYPVYNVSYNEIRGSSEGAKWPATNSVDATSFLGKLRARTGIDFDLPTEAQWEYTCRAGTTTTYSYGDSVNGDYMWYTDNSSDSSHEVGTKKENPWGFCDMHGNVWELCLDWYDWNRHTTRGGYYGDDASGCTSFSRYGLVPSACQIFWPTGSHPVGFRLCRPIP